jgi:hypothetical protein
MSFDSPLPRSAEGLVYDRLGSIPAIADAAIEFTRAGTSSRTSPLTLHQVAHAPGSAMPLAIVAPHGRPDGPPPTQIRAALHFRDVPRGCLLLFRDILCPSTGRKLALQAGKLCLEGA